MKKHFTLNFCKVLLNISLVVSVILLFMCTLGIFVHKFSLNLIIFPLICLAYFLIIYNLRKIVYSTNSTPFCADNVKRFKSIGYYMLLISISDAIINFKSPSNFEMFATKYGSLKGSFLIYLVITCIAFVLAEIFEKAVILKNEHDLTI